MALTGRPFMAWQQHAADVSQELDPATGLRWYRLVIAIVPRQCGKSSWMDAQLIHGALRRPSSTSLYMAQSQDYAGRRLIEELVERQLDHRPFFRNRYKPYRSNGKQRINWWNGSKTNTAANNSTAGHGLTIDADAIVDEAFAHRDLTSIQALSPTQVTCQEPQLWIVSTLGDGTDGLLQHFQDIAAAAIHDPESRTCVIDYGAADGLPVDDPATWRSAIPALGTSITETELRHQLLTMGEAEFDRAFLCRRRPETHESKIQPEVWHAQARSIDEAMPLAPLVLVADVEHDRSAAVINVTGLTAAGELVTIIDRRPGTSWLLPELRRLQRERRPAAIVADRRAPVGSMVDRLEAELGPLLQPDSIEFSQAAGLFVDELVHGHVVHVGQPELDVAAAQARTRPLNDLWTWSRRDSPCGIAALCAATLGVWAHRKLYPNAHRGRIH